MDQRRAMMNRWADYLALLKLDSPTSARRSSAQLATADVPTLSRQTIAT